MQHKLSDKVTLINQMVLIRKPAKDAKPLEQGKNKNKNNNNKRRSDQERMDLNIKKKQLFSA